MRLTLRAREALAITTVVLLVVAVLTAAHLANVARITLKAAADEGELLARQLYHQSSRVVAASSSRSPVRLRQDPGIRALLEGMVGYSHTVVYAAIVDPAGLVLVHSAPALEGGNMPPRESLERVKTWGPWRTVVSMLGAPRIYEAQLPMRRGERPFGTVRVGVSTSLLRQELERTAFRSLAVAAGALVVAVAVGLGAGHVLLQSLKKITQGMERLARGEYGTAVDLTRDDELGELAARVNQLGERVDAEHTHLEGEKVRMEGILNTLEDAVLLLSPRREVVFCNQTAETMLGRPLSTMAGQALDTLLAPDHPLVLIVSELFERGVEHRNLAVKIPRPDGASQELAVSSYSIQDGTRVGGGVLALKNLDPVRAVQSLVTYSQKLAALGRLTSGVAHEVRNPLNAMRIHLELLQTRLAAGRPEAQENADVIAQEIHRLDRVVQGFLRFMRPEELRVAAVDVNALLEEVARLIAPEANGLAARVTLDLAPGLSPALADRELLQQACTNLVTNALQSMPNGGTLTLGTRRATEGAIEIRVADEGIGIPTEDLDKIFRLYYTTKPSGSGLGLSLVYRIMQMHDGRIDVESEMGRGTTMILTLPMTPGSTST